eukprot:CAMPEP_0185714186 /NCGR_PEP_ID=MMETSP1164-20130828/38272_1 /TAXON_ID=1104430 /ORGANISM="Chrysoreinhardia sp, Strain CCMP2950" /LENGTH=114 /DNA_ID=CAMNT_0028381765 /DNA_START=11 /DNA_END=352 /DNA_ORIENTATION=+
MDANIYGMYSDPYLDGATNPEMLDLTSDGAVVPPGATDIEAVNITLEYPTVAPPVPFVELPETMCLDSDTWHKNGDLSKDCPWAALWAPRCDAIGFYDEAGTQVTKTPETELVY